MSGTDTDVVVNSGENFENNFSEYWHKMFSSIMCEIVRKYGWSEVEGVIETETLNMSFDPADFDYGKTGQYTIKLETNIDTSFMATVDYDKTRFHIVDVDKL